MRFTLEALLAIQLLPAAYLLSTSLPLDPSGLGTLMAVLRWRPGLHNLVGCTGGGAVVRWSTGVLAVGVALGATLWMSLARIQRLRHRGIRPRGLNTGSSMFAPSSPRGVGMTSDRDQPPLQVWVHMSVRQRSRPCLP